MSDFLRRMRTAVDAFARAWRDGPSAVPQASSIPIVEGPRITFADANASPENPATWLAVFEMSVERATPVSRKVLETIGERAGQYSADTFLSTDAERARFLRWLRPRPGLTSALADMRASGLLGRIFPSYYGAASRTGTSSAPPGDDHPIAAVAYLENLPREATLTG